MRRLHIGLFGGTFDPPHIGHLVVADQVRQQCQLDEIWFIVANHPWQKDGTRLITPAELRLRWVELATSGAAELRASDVEIELGGASYMIDTLDALRLRHPTVDFTLILGADAAAGLDTWHRSGELASQIEVIVVNRPGEHSDPPPGWTTRLVEIPALDISSSELRSMVAAGRSIRFLVPDEVVDSVESTGVYRQPT